MELTETGYFDDRPGFPALDLLRGRLAWLRSGIERADREAAERRAILEQIERQRALAVQACKDLEEAIGVLEAAQRAKKPPVAPKPDGARAFLLEKQGEPGGPTLS